MSTFMRTKGFRHRVLSLPVEVWWALMETPPLWHATIYMVESRKSRKKPQKIRKAIKKPAERQKKYLAVNQKSPFFIYGKWKM